MARVKSQKSQKRRKTFVRFLPIYILMLPGLIYLFINNYMPLPGLVIAFKQYNAGKGIYGSACSLVGDDPGIYRNQHNIGNCSSYYLK